MPISFNAMSDKMKKFQPPYIFTENPVLPSSYNVTYVTLIARDPYWIYAYWEIAAHTLQEAKRRLGAAFAECSLVLRMYDVTSVDFDGKNANHSFDIDVGYQVKNWYINLWCDNVSYCAELGLKRADGCFEVLSRSNVVTTPRASFSGRQDIIWMEKQGQAVSPPFVCKEPRTEQQDPKFVKKDIVPPESKKGRASRRYLSEEDIRAYYARLFPRLRQVRGKRKTARVGSGGERSLKDILGPKISSGGREIPAKDNPLISGFLQKEYGRDFFIGTSAEFMRKGGASEHLHLEGRGHEGASERPVSKPRTFFFEIGTELIVYGRTEPDAQVFLGDKNIPLRADGTFSLRFALPDASTIPLDFTAESSDQLEKRFIQTSAIRTKTKYGP
jgi:hypothetical protein